MESKILFCVLVFIIAQYWLTHADAKSKAPKSKSTDSSGCQNDTDCECGLRCYTDRCHFKTGKSASKSSGSASGGKCKPEFVIGCDDRYGFCKECLEYTDEFKRIPGYEAYYYYSAHFQNETVESCQELCLNDTTCINFYFEADVFDCYLVDLSLAEVIMYEIFYPNTCFDFYARECLYC